MNSMSLPYYHMDTLLPCVHIYTRSCCCWCCCVYIRNIFTFMWCVVETASDFTTSQLWRCIIAVTANRPCAPYTQRHPCVYVHVLFSEQRSTNISLDIWWIYLTHSIVAHRSSGRKMGNWNSIGQTLYFIIFPHLHCERLPEYKCFFWLRKLIKIRKHLELCSVSNASSVITGASDVMTEAEMCVAMGKCG